MKGFYKYLIVLFLCSSGSIWAQVQFEASVSRNTVAQNERVRIDFSMNTDGDNFKAPDFDGFEIVGGPNQSISYSWNNGNKTFNKTYSYFLLPTKKGTLTIGSASIEIDGQIYQSKPITITITDAVKKETANLNYSQEQALKGIRFVAEVSNYNPYESEPVTIIYKVYVKRNVNLVGWRPKEIPTYKNFWVNEIEMKDLEINQGEEEYSIIFKKDIVIAQESGNYEIEPLTMDFGIEAFTGRRDFLGFPEIDYITKTFTTGKKTIKVKPLPEEGKPENFSGAVGKFDFKVMPSSNELKAGDPFSLNIEISGRGNMNLFSIPTPEASSTLEVYDPEYTEKINSGLYGLQGKKANKYTIIPLYKGEYSINPMSFSYFDLDSKTYKTITSKKIPIHVLEGKTLPTNEENNSENTIGEKDLFQDIKTKTNFNTHKQSDYWKSTWFYILTIFPLLAIPLFVEIVKQKRKREGNVESLRLKMNKRLAKKYLGEAKKNILNKEVFYEALERCLFNFLKAKLKIETTEMSNNNIKEILESNNISQESINSFLDLKNNCEFARYTPTTQVNMNRDFDKAIEVIAQLENQFK